MMVLREYDDFCNTHRPYRALDQAAPLRSLSDGVADLVISGSGGMMSSTNIALCHRFPAPAVAVTGNVGLMLHKLAALSPRSAAPWLSWREWGDCPRSADVGASVRPGESSPGCCRARGGP
jgi:hypothetical protein